MQNGVQDASREGGQGTPVQLLPPQTLMLPSFQFQEAAVEGSHSILLTSAGTANSATGILPSVKTFAGGGGVTAQVGTHK